MRGAAAPVVPALAATVVLIRPGLHGAEVLLTHRPTTMAFAADLHVFPGGRVDPADATGPAAAGEAHEAARRLGGNLAPADALAVHRAALRELHEEAGVVVAPIERLAPMAHWTTPRFMPRRFSTWFFVADLPPGAEPEFSADEVVAHRWLTPAAALEQVASGEIGMWVPTTSVLEQLIALRAGAAGDVARALTFGSVASPELVEVGPAMARWTFGAMGAVPGRTGLTEIHGRDEVVVVDPGDPSETAIDAIESHVAERGAAIRAIVLTATDPDHAAGAEALAIPLGIPILVAPGAGRHLPYATVEVADGQRLPADVDLRVRLGPAGVGRLQIVASAGE